MFQQAVLSPSLPEDIKVFQLTDKKLLPERVQGQVQNNLHVWVVTNGEWSHLALPHEDGISHHLIGVFNRLQHPLKVHYFYYNYFIITILTGC